VREGPTIRRNSLLGFATLIVATGFAVAPAAAGPLAKPPACAAATGSGCTAPGLLRADWLDDLFGLSLPPGSWRDSCRKARVDGHFLIAECRRKSGAYRNTTFDLRNCGGDIAYENGKFFCARGERGAGEGAGPNKPVDPGKD
jgi:hypothetical protein